MKALKYYLMVSWAVASCNYCFAQTSKGNLILGGSLEFSKSKVDQDPRLTPTVDDVLNFSLSPGISYFVVDNLSVGLIMPLSYSQRSIQEFFTKVSSISIGVTGRYYFSFGRAALFPEVSYSVGWQKMSIFTNFGRNEFNQEVRALDLGIGATYFLTKNIGVEGVVFYQNNDRFTFTKESSIHFRAGFQVYLNKNNKVDK